MTKDHKRVIKLKDEEKKDHMQNCPYGLVDNCFYCGYWG